MNRSILLIFFFLLHTAIVYGQKKKKKTEDLRSPKQELIYADKNYLPSIHSVQLFPLGKESQFPIIALDTDEKLQLDFDDLRADVRNYYYSIEHCNANWEPSRLSPLDYAVGFNEDRIDDIQSSAGTLQHYTHYRLTFPTEYVKPKVAGNYLLKVYEDADKNRLILTRKFYVYRSLLVPKVEITPSPTVAHRMSHQKINITLTSSALHIENPQREVEIVVLQNGRNDYILRTNDPMYIGNTEIRYTKNETLDFKGNAEFRFADLRSFRLPSSQVKTIQQDSTTAIQLVTDMDLSSQQYGSTFDENGKFFVRNQDVSGDENNTADYAHVTFSLRTNQDIKGKIYLVGGFNNFTMHSDYELKYDHSLKLWSTTIKLKQGLYDYDYIFVDEMNNISTDKFSGSYFETGNTYQILIYNRRPGTYWDEISGYTERKD